MHNHFTVLHCFLIIITFIIFHLHSKSFCFFTEFKLIRNFTGSHKYALDYCCQSLTGDWSEDRVAALGGVAGEEAEQLPGHWEPHSVLGHHRDLVIKM